MKRSNCTFIYIKVKYTAKESTRYMVGYVKQFCDEMKLFCASRKFSEKEKVSLKSLKTKRNACYTYCYKICKGLL